MAKIVGNWGGGAIWQISSGIFPSNCYFCSLDDSGSGFLIDPGLDGEIIDAQLSEKGLCPTHIFCTHGHFDHIGSASFFQKKYDTQVFLHKCDARSMKSSNFLLMALNIPCRITLPLVTYVEEDFYVYIGNEKLQYFYTPGHTPGSCVIEFGSAWFTGDTLYSFGVGLSNLPGEDREKLRISIESLWPRLQKGRTIYPGHGEPADGCLVRNKNLPLLEFLGHS